MQTRMAQQRDTTHTDAMLMSPTTVSPLFSSVFAQHLCVKIQLCNIGGSGSALEPWRKADLILSSAGLWISCEF